MLYRAFDSFGGVAAYITTRRLDRAFEALVARRDRALTIGEIARRHGFTSDAHFSRAFRARFGLSPREVEDMPGGPDGAAISLGAGPAPAALNWMKSL
jgi:AraC-like DNA-binding protein